VLAQAFVKQLKTIKTNSPVSAITQDKDGVTVKVGSVGYQADYVVLAVPLRALNKIQMTPALDAQHLAALKGTNYGWRDQIMLKFKTPVWESRRACRRDLQQHRPGHAVGRAGAQGRRQRGDQPVRRQRPPAAGVRRQADGRSGADSPACVLPTGPWCVHRL
jgi:hypothetical protein